MRDDKQVVVKGRHRENGRKHEGDPLDQISLQCGVGALAAVEVEQNIQISLQVLHFPLMHLGGLVQSVIHGDARPSRQQYGRARQCRIKILNNETTIKLTKKAAKMK
jgi:hypothetical protein